MEKTSDGFDQVVLVNHNHEKRNETSMNFFFICDSLNFQMVTWQWRHRLFCFLINLNFRRLILASAQIEREHKKEEKKCLSLTKTDCKLLIMVE